MNEIKLGNLKPNHTKPRHPLSINTNPTQPTLRLRAQPPPRHRRLRPPDLRERVLHLPLQHPFPVPRALAWMGMGVCVHQPVASVDLTSQQGKGRRAGRVTASCSID